ncbi:hypothetical protein ACTGOH_005027, partial [Salmonella enterica subsp. enterica serovar Bareilly]
NSYAISPYELNRVLANYLPLKAKAADSNLLDGLDSLQFIRRDIDQTVNGSLSLTKQTNLSAPLVSTSTASFGSEASVTRRLTLNDSSGSEIIFTKGTQSLSNKENFVVRAWGNSATDGARDTVFEAGDETGYHFYSQRAADNRVSFNINGTLYSTGIVSTNGLNVTGVSTFTGPISATGEIVSSSPIAFRAINGNYGVMLYNAGNSSYIALTNSGDQTGTFNNLRPITINNATGLVRLDNGVQITSGATITTGGLTVNNRIISNGVKTATVYTDKPTASTVGFWSID